MTTLVARPPLQSLSSSAMQAGSRRLSARLQEKDHVPVKHNGTHIEGSARRQAPNGQTEGTMGSKKRKNNYDEEDDGFTFARVSKSKKPRQSRNDASSSTAKAESMTTSLPTTNTTKPPIRDDAAIVPSSKSTAEAEEVSKKRRKKMSFSTPKAKDPQPLRRSKRLSTENTEQQPSPVGQPMSTSKRAKESKEPDVAKRKVEKPVDADQDNDVVPVATQQPENVEISKGKRVETKIALPFADTPVIRRNKAMREGKGSKSDRRSSLGLRGRRASSLIDTGNSNALPHQEVEEADFYKHIESSLLEPRRMRQLLTWCATRSMHAKPKGTDFEDASAKSAARVIEEELLKELSNKSELSDWFSREDIPEPSKPLPERPNPKNIQNTQKIAELEEQISRLKAEKASLQALLHPPKILQLPEVSAKNVDVPTIDRSLLSDEDAALLDSLNTSISNDVSRRINDISSNLGPAVDVFADGIHKIAQYKTATDNLAGTVLSICAEKIADRERAGRRKALHSEEDRSPGRDLGDVLRGLSRAER